MARLRQRGERVFLQIDDFFTDAELRQVAELARQAKFIEGRRSNPHNVAKNSLIIDPADPQGQQAGQMALAAFQRNELARGFAFPQRIAVPQLARYGTGMSYGVHTDAAFLPAGQGQPLRSDISCTLFINDPSAYQGGDLVIYLGAQEVRIRGNPGMAVFYPSTSLHQVTPVTSGERLVMLTFIQSQLPDEHQRNMLYILNEVRAAEGLKMDWGSRTRLEYLSMNLMRMWAK
jgi:PKHD-type hydroxylase